MDVSEDDAPKPKPKASPAKKAKSSPAKKAPTSAKKAPAKAVAKVRLFQGII